MRRAALSAAYWLLVWVQFFWTTLISVPVEVLDLWLDDSVRKLEIARLHAAALDKVRERERRRG